MHADRMDGAAAQTRRPGKAENIRRAAPVLLALLAEHKERVAATCPAGDTSPVRPVVGSDRGDIERRAS